MKKQKGFSYFQAFVDLADFSTKALEILKATLHNFASVKIDQQLKAMHDVEHAADLAKHDLLTRLTKEFLPPFEREDIIKLADLIDDVTDAIEDVLINIAIFDVRIITQEYLEFLTVVEKCCGALVSALIEFENYKKSKTIQNWIIEVNRLEETGDRLYFTGVRQLFKATFDAAKLLAGKEIYNSFEKCCDNCEAVANFVENIIVKNS